MSPGSESIPASVREDLQRLVQLVRAQRGELQGLTQVTEGSASDPLPAAVSQWLYQNWYCALPSPDNVSFQITLQIEGDLAAALRAAVAGSQRWLPNWVALGTAASGACVAGRRGETRELKCGEYASIYRPGLPVAPGDAVAVMECLDWVDAASGFWTTRSRFGHPVAPMSRFYVSVDVEAVFQALTSATTALDGLEVPYSLKCPVRAADFARTDSLIIYVERRHLPVTRKALVTGLETSRLRPFSPPLTKRLRPGLSMADDFAVNESFGQNRCNALAVPLAEAVRSNRLERFSVRSCLAGLRRSSIDPHRPWVCRTAR